MDAPRCTSHKIKLFLKGILFTTLLILFYFMYMKKALDQFIKGSTTIVHTQETDQFSVQPVLIACTTPPFKRSFFKKHAIHSDMGLKAFWMFEQYPKKFENDSSMLDVYMNMSYTLRNDWEIKLVSLM